MLSAPLRRGCQTCGALHRAALKASQRPFCLRHAPAKREGELMQPEIKGTASTTIPWKRTKKSTRHYATSIWEGTLIIHKNYAKRSYGQRLQGKPSSAPASPCSELALTPAQSVPQKEPCMPSGIPQPGPTDSFSTLIPECPFTAGAVLSLHQDPPPSPGVFPGSWLKAGPPCSWSDADSRVSGKRRPEQSSSPPGRSCSSLICAYTGRNTHGEQGSPAPGG